MLALLRREPGADRVEQWVGGGSALISWINLGEVWYTVARRWSAATATAAVDGLLAQVDARLPDQELVLEAARLKAGHRISYADAFAVATAARSGAPLLTGDPEILALPALCEIEDLRRRS